VLAGPPSADAEIPPRPWQPSAPACATSTSTRPSGRARSRGRSIDGSLPLVAARPPGPPTPRRDRTLLDAYGIEPDPARTAYYRLLWDLSWRVSAADRAGMRR
jgi:hypothetical protein